MRIIIYIFVSFLFLSTSYAEPVVLKCVTDTGETALDLTIDLKNKKMIWGTDIEYNITYVNDTYISAYSKPHGVGGEVWVINRISGMYKRGLVGIYYSVPKKPDDDGTFNAIAYSGRCLKQQF